MKINVTERAGKVLKEAMGDTAYKKPALRIRIAGVG